MADSKYEIGIVATATAIINEDPGTTDHALRLAIAIEWWDNPKTAADWASTYLASQSITPSNTQSEINNALSALLSTMVAVDKLR